MTALLEFNIANSPTSFYLFKRTISTRFFFPLKRMADATKKVAALVAVRVALAQEDVAHSSGRGKHPYLKTSPEDICRTQ